MLFHLHTEPGQDVLGSRRDVLRSRLKFLAGSRLESRQSRRDLTKNPGGIHFQASEFLFQTQNTTVAFDATTQEGLHVNEIHATSKEKAVVLALDQLAGGTATDYADHVVKTVEHLAQTYCSINTKINQEQGELSVKEVNKTMQSHIKCSLTDRAAANHAAIRIVTEEFGSTLVEINCHLHPLDTIATKSKTALKSLEPTGVKSKLFSGTCRAERVIIAMNKMRFKDSKGDPHGFRVFLTDLNLSLSLITRYRGNRLHILFRLAATYIQYHQELKFYLEKKSDLKTGLIEEFYSTEIISQLQVLGVFGKVLTGPWMKTFYRNAETQLQESYHELPCSLYLAKSGRRRIRLLNTSCPIPKQRVL
jgi:hypothetical protein